MCEELREPTLDEEQRIVSAAVQKAVRLFVLPEAPLGSFGGMGDMAAVTVRRDHEIAEHLYGLIDRCWNLSAVTWPDAETVIRVGFGLENMGFPADKVPDVDRAIASARDWVATYMTDAGVGIG